MCCRLVYMFMFFLLCFKLHNRRSFESCLISEGDFVTTKRADNILVRVDQNQLFDPPSLQLDLKCPRQGCRRFLRKVYQSPHD